MKKLVNGELLDLTEEELNEPKRSGRVLPPPPTEMEIRLAALEKKAGVTEQDKLTAKTELMTKGE